MFLVFEALYSVVRILKIQRIKYQYCISHYWLKIIWGNEDQKKKDENCWLH